MDRQNDLFKVKVMVVNSCSVSKVKYVYRGSHFIARFAKRNMFGISVIACIVANILLILNMVAPL